MSSLTTSGIHRHRKYQFQSHVEPEADCTSGSIRLDGNNVRMYLGAENMGVEKGDEFHTRLA